MAQASSDPNIKQTSRGTLLLGDLPAEFLRVAPDEGTQNQVQSDEQLAQQLAAREIQQQRMQPPVMIVERLMLSILEAKLNKNYGLARMDPYCRVRVNHSVYETETSYNGGKNPHWNKTVTVPMTEPIENIYVEILDERSFASDSRIASTQIKLPESVQNGEQLDDWWALSGKLGEEKEGLVHIVLSKKKVQQSLNPAAVPMVYPAGYPMVAPAGAYYPPTGMPVYYPQAAGAQPQPQQAPVQQGPLYTESDIKQVKEMFPDVDEEAIKTVLEASRGNKDAAINSLLSMQ